MSADSLDHARAFELVRERFAEAQRAFLAIEAAHLEGRYQGQEHDAFVAAVEAMRDAAAQYHAIIDAEYPAE